MNAVHCWIITVGDELLNGIRADTNTAWLADRLTGSGIGVDRGVTVGDEDVSIQTVLGNALDEADVVIMCGGLGPTQDDRTKQAVADFFEVGMNRQSGVEESVRSFFISKGREATQVNLDQALVPDGFEWCINPLGTAPGMLKRHGSVLLFVLPGVPSEMKALYEEWVAPLLESMYGGKVTYERRWFRTVGIGESDLFERIGGMEDLAPGVSLAYLPGPHGVALYLAGSGEDSREVGKWLDIAEARILETAGDFVYASENLDITEHIARLLLDKGETLAVAESCTGGLIAHSFTNIPGASEWFVRGWVTYSNESKEEELGVPGDLMVEHGAVSEPVAHAMAVGARERAASDWAVAVTGIAGPGGGTEEKPVGLTFVACAGRDETVVRRYMLGEGGRRRNKTRSMTMALDLFRRMLEDLDHCDERLEIHR